MVHGAQGSLESTVKQLAPGRAATMGPSEKLSYDITELRPQLYWDLPADIDPIRRLLERYSGVPPEEVEKHILAVRQNLWNIKPYGCIGKFRFLQLDFAADPRYQDALKRLTRRCTKDALLDVGCCVGQMLRKMVVDGVDSSRLFGTDLEPRFLEMGYEMFRDKGRLRSMFVAGDVLDHDDDPKDPLRLLDGKMTIIHAASFFHLFTWDDQVAAATRLVRFLKPGDKNAFIFGRQVGCEDPGYQQGPKGYTRYLHNAASWQKMWNEVGQQTGTRWRTEVDVIPESGDAVTKSADVNFEFEGLNRIRFGVYRA
ncbi:uncharacterized protein JN550_005660 [Neoarthrinium moseri]|uniref:uncharacterized protein n=1 Tax=Neoarthrinium moseri TaxID=1658444 RepID=UPI001FDC66FC|nr:uncharacterized protein JN550_005660 [Neoarthrinium moseri]KAI1869679.1 hypothetical protein JN550_005660 [Neoarthrinium moseri]